MDKILETLFLITRLKDKEINLNLEKYNIKIIILDLLDQKEFKDI